MKYFLLAQWVMENRSRNLIIHQIRMSPGVMSISFKEGASLVFHYKTSSPVLYFSEAKKNESFTSGQIWTNLNNTNLYDIEIADADRIITFKLRLKDIYQKVVESRLVFECMPPQANLILCQIENEKLVIQDALLKFTYADNPQRQILSGLIYESPRTNFKAEQETVVFPLMIKVEQQSDAAKREDDITVSQDRHSTLQSETQERSLTQQSGNIIACESVNDYFRQYYTQVIEQKELLQRKQKMVSKWKKELSKAEKKLAQQQIELVEAELEKTWLTYSELLKVNLQQIKKGDVSLQTTNYFDPDLQQISIPLKADKSPQDNLKYYLKKYHKAKQGREKIAVQIDKTQKDIGQIKKIQAILETDQWQDLEIEAVHAGEALAKLKQTDNLFRLPVNEHWEIIIGRKAKENDLITTQIGKPNDWWFHTRIYHGSHILLRNFHKNEPPNSLIELCCGLAAGFSKAKNSENVPVDYTQIRFVRKPRKSAPGLVTYTNHKTVFVDPIDVSSAKQILAAYEE